MPKILEPEKLRMGSMVLSCKAWVNALGSWALFLVAHALIHSKTYTKVLLFSQSTESASDIIVLQGSVGLVSRFGQFYKSVDPGLVQVNVCTESLRIVDVKIQISPIGRQTVMYVFTCLYYSSDLDAVLATMSTSKCTCNTAGIPVTYT